MNTRTVIIAEASKLERDNLCQCGKFILITKAENGEDLCTGSHWDGDAFHSRYRCGVSK